MTTLPTQLQLRILSSPCSKSVIAIQESTMGSTSPVILIRRGGGGYINKERGGGGILRGGGHIRGRFEARYRNTRIKDRIHVTCKKGHINKKRGGIIIRGGGILGERGHIEIVS